MSTYRRVWGVCACVLVAVGVCLAVLIVAWDVLVFSALALFTAVVAFASAFAENRSWHQAVWPSLVVTSSLVGAVGALALLGPAGVVPIAVVGLSAPRVVRACSRRTRAGRGEDWPLMPSSRASLEEVGAARAWSAEQTLSRQCWMDGATRDLGPDALCRAWRDSCLALFEPISVTYKAGIVQRRRELLDELERRNPPGFSAWLASGAQAAEDPRRYIVSPPR